MLSIHRQKYLYICQKCLFTCELHSIYCKFISKLFIWCIRKMTQRFIAVATKFLSNGQIWNQFFFNFYLGQRLVLYLAAADLMFSIPHPLDHIYSLFQIEAAYEVFCTIAAFILQVNAKIYERNWLSFIINCPRQRCKHLFSLYLNNSVSERLIIK